LYTALKSVSGSTGPLQWDQPHAARFKAAMDDDFNTPEAIAVLFELANDLNRLRDPALAGMLCSLGALLGLLRQDPATYLQKTSVAGEPTQGLSKAVDEYIADRLAARKAKNFAESDRIRDVLESAGIILEDGPQGTTWRRK
jgi:cysteinyl-tRNA synthetase